MPARPPKEYQFKPGQSGNPKGRPKNPIPDVLKKLTNQSLRKIVRAVVKGNVDKLQLMVHPDTRSNYSALEVSIASAFLTAIKKGDYGTVEHILQRVLGKVPDRIDVTSKNLNANLNAKINTEKIKLALKKLEEDI